MAGQQENDLASRARYHCGRQRDPAVRAAGYNLLPLCAACGREPSDVSMGNRADGARSSSSSRCCPGTTLPTFISYRNDPRSMRTHATHTKSTGWFRDERHISSWAVSLAARGFATRCDRRDHRHSPSLL